jgi:RNA polymerase sigma-70 factor (ECF subfamily)
MNVIAWGRKSVEKVRFRYRSKVQDAERRYLLDPRHDLTPEKLYERRWATTQLDRALEKLRMESRQLNQFERLRIFLTGEPPGASYRELASELGMSEGALKVAVHRLRGKFRDVLRAEIADTVASQEAVKEEMRYLLSVVSE